MLSICRVPQVIRLSNVGTTNKGKIIAWLMSLLWQISSFGVAVVARAFRNDVAAGVGLFISALHNLFSFL